MITHEAFAFQPLQVAGLELTTEDHISGLHFSNHSTALQGLHFQAELGSEPDAALLKANSTAARYGRAGII